MITNWMLIALNIIAFLFFAVMVIYYRSVIEQEQNKISSLKVTLEEAEILIKKYQIQLQKVLGSVDALNTELVDAKEDLKSLKSRFSRLRTEDERNRIQVKKLQAKIESLI